MLLARLVMLAALLFGAAPAVSAENPDAAPIVEPIDKAATLGKNLREDQVSARIYNHPLRHCSRRADDCGGAKRQDAFCWHPGRKIVCAPGQTRS